MAMKVLCCADICFELGSSRFKFDLRARSRLELEIVPRQVELLFLHAVRFDV